MSIQRVLFLGLGRIGLPQALVFAKRGVRVYGYDVDPEVVRSLRDGRGSPFGEPSMEEYLTATLDSAFFPLDSWEDALEILPDIDFIFFTVGTAPTTSPSSLEDPFDLTAIEAVLDDLAASGRLKRAVKLVFRTTLPLGSMEHLRDHLEQASGLHEGSDVHLAFVPERLVEGQAIEEEETLPKIIGTFNDQAFQDMEALFGRIGGKIIRVSSPRAAELCKLTDNSWRNTLFSFANEIAMLCSENELDVLEVIRAANEDYPRTALPHPGFVSGNCLGKDPYILERSFTTLRGRRGFPSVWYVGRQANDHLLDYAVDRILDGWDGEALSRASVTVLGLSFKEDVDDFRLSHGVQLCRKLLMRGVGGLRIFDPNLGTSRYTSVPADVADHVTRQGRTLTPELFDDVDAVLIAHRHKAIVEADRSGGLPSLLTSARNPLRVFDGWNVWRSARNLPGVRYDALGLGDMDNV